MDSPDLLGVIASKCEDARTGFYLTIVNRHTYQALSKQRSALRFKAAREKIKDHVAELPTRIVATRYTIIKPNCFVQVNMSMRGKQYNTILMIPRPLGMKQLYPEVALVLATHSWLYIGSNHAAHKYEYGCKVQLNGYDMQRASQVYGGWHQFLKRMAYSCMGYDVR